MDRFSPEHRTKIMKSIRSTGSKIELRLIEALTQEGCVFETYAPDVIGKPDIVFRAQRVAVFCDGEFWHGYDWETRKNDHINNREFWHKKIERNIERDQQVSARLEAKGWSVLRFWGKQIEKELPDCLQKIHKALSENNRYFMDNEHIGMAAEDPPKYKKPKKKKPD